MFDSTLPRHPSKLRRSTEHPADLGVVVEDVESGFCGAIVSVDKHGVVLEDRHGARRSFPLGPGFWIDGEPVALTRPVASTPTSRRTASGSVAMQGARARVARESRIYVEGRHDAELVEKVWGDDLRVEGVVVEELGGADDLVEIVRDFRPAPGRRLGVLLDHLVDGSKETAIATEVSRLPGAGSNVLVLGHPYVDIWQAVKPSVVGLRHWPEVPRGMPWKEGVVKAVGWDMPTYAAWQRILGSVRTFGDLEPALLGRVEELIDFVTSPAHTDVD